MKNKASKIYDFEKMTPSDWEDFIASKGPNAEDNLGRIPIVYACYECFKGNYELLKLLIDSRADIHLKIGSGATLLHLAIENETSYGIVELLIEKGININAVNNLGFPPICYSRKKDITELLIKNGADVNIAAHNGNTPLHTALTPEVLEVLIELGAQVNV